MKNATTKRQTNTNVDANTSTSNWFTQTLSGRITTCFIALWFWFLIGSALVASSAPSGYYYDPTNSIVISVIVSALGIIGYICGLVWVGKAIVKNSKKEKFIHWLDILINSIFYSVGFSIVSVIATLLLILPALAILGYGPMIAMQTASVFGALCTITLIFGMFLASRFIKQGLIMEANIKAAEMYNGNKRAQNYYKD